MEINSENNQLLAEEVLCFAQAVVREAGKILKESVNIEVKLNYKNNDYKDIVTK